MTEVVKLNLPFGTVVLCTNAVAQGWGLTAKFSANPRYGWCLAVTGPAYRVAADSCHPLDAESFSLCRYQPASPSGLPSNVQEAFRDSAYFCGPVLPLIPNSGNCTS
jgi:hypothetical protein